LCGVLCYIADPSCAPLTRAPVRRCFSGKWQPGDAIGRSHHACGCPYKLCRVSGLNSAGSGVTSATATHGTCADRGGYCTVWAQLQARQLEPSKKWHQVWWGGRSSAITKLLNDRPTTRGALTPVRTVFLLPVLRLHVKNCRLNIKNSNSNRTVQEPTENFYRLFLTKRCQVHERIGLPRVAHCAVFFS
jgi:hypothetical protein